MVDVERNDAFEEWMDVTRNALNGNLRQIENICDGLIKAKRPNSHNVVVLKAMTELIASGFEKRNMYTALKNYHKVLVDNEKNFFGDLADVGFYNFACCLAVMVDVTATAWASDGSKKDDIRRSDHSDDLVATMLEQSRAGSYEAADSTGLLAGSHESRLSALLGIKDEHEHTPSNLEAILQDSYALTMATDMDFQCPPFVYAATSKASTAKTPSTSRKRSSSIDSPSSGMVTDGPFQCPNCEKKCRHSVALRKHMRRYHIPNSRAYEYYNGLPGQSHKCTLCPKEFASEYKLKNHHLQYHDTTSMSYKRLHGKTGAKFACEECGIEFGTQSAVKHHRDQLHNNQELPPEAPAEV